MTHLFDKKYSQNSNPVKYYINLKYSSNVFLWWQTWIFSIITSLQFQRLFRNHFNMLIWCSRNIFYYYHRCWKQLSCFSEFLDKQNIQISSNYLKYNYFDIIRICHFWSISSSSSSSSPLLSLVTSTSEISHPTCPYIHNIHMTMG